MLLYIHTRIAWICSWYYVMRDNVQDVIVPGIYILVPWICSWYYVMRDNMPQLVINSTVSCILVPLRCTNYFALGTFSFSLSSDGLVKKMLELTTWHSFVFLHRDVFFYSPFCDHGPIRSGKCGDVRTLS